MTLSSLESGTYLPPDRPRPRPKAAKPIDNTARLRVEDLEKRQLFTNNVWLPQSLTPIEGASPFAPTSQLFRPVLSNLRPSLGLQSATLSLAGSFSLTDTGAYSLSLYESGTAPFGSFVFSESGTISFSLTDSGTFNSSGFSAGCLVLSQTASLSWSYLQTNSGQTLQYLTGHDSFTVTSLGTAVLDPFFAAGFNWYDPTAKVSSLHSLGLFSMMASSFSLNETNGSDSFTFTQSNVSATLSGNGTQALMNSLDQSGVQSTTETVTESLTFTNSGSDTFTLSAAGTVTAGRFSLNSVAYNESGTAAFQLSDSLNAAATGTTRGSGSQAFSANQHSLSDSTGDTLQFSELDTTSYGESGSGTYSLYEGGTYGNGSFNLSSLSYNGQGSGTLSLTMTAAQTQTGTFSDSSNQSGTDSYGVAGTATDAGTVTSSGNLTATALETTLENETANYSFSELGAYASTTFGLSSVNVSESASGGFTVQHTDTLTENGTDTTTTAGAGTDSFSQGLGGVHTVGGVGTTNFTATDAGTFSETATDSSTQTGSSSYTFFESGVDSGGSGALTSYLFRSGIAGSTSDTDTVTLGDRGSGSATDSGTDGNNASSNLGGVSGNDLGNDTFQSSDCYAYNDTETSVFSDSSNFGQGTYQEGSFSNSQFAFISVAYNQSSSDCWSLTDSASSSDSGSDSSTDSSTGQGAGTTAAGALSFAGLSNETALESATDCFTDNRSDALSESGGNSFTFKELGSYGGESYNFTNVSYSAAGSATDTALDSGNDSFTGSGNDSLSDSGNQNSTGTSGIGTSSALDTATGSDRSTFTDSAAETVTGTVTSSDSWNIYEAGSFSNGSWSLSSVAYGESYSDTVTWKTTDSSSDSGTDSAASAETSLGGDTSIYGGGSFQGTDTRSSNDNSSDSFSDQANDTMTASGQDNYSLTELGSFSGFSFAFSSYVFSGSDSFSETFLQSSADTLGGTATDNSSDQGQGNGLGTFASSSLSASDNFNDSSNDSVTTTGTDNFAETVSETDQVTFYQAGSLTNGFLALSSVNSLETVTSSFSQQGAGTSTEFGTSNANDTTIAGGTNGTLAASGLSSATANGTTTENSTGSLSDTWTDSFNINGTSSWSLSEQGSYANNSYAFSSWLFQSSDSISETQLDASTDSFTGTVTDNGNGNDSGTSAGTVGVSNRSLSGSSLDTANGATSDGASDSSGHTLTRSLSDSLFEAGCFSFGSYALTSVAFSSGGRDTWSDQATDNSTETANDSLTARGTFGAGGTLGYAALGRNSQDSVSGDATFLGTDSSTDSSTTTDSGNDCWGFTEQGIFSSQSYSLNSVVYRSTESDSGTYQQSSGECFSDSAAVTATESSQNAGSNSVSMATESGQDSATDSGTLAAGIQEQASYAFTDTGSSSATLYRAGSYSGDSFAFASISYQASGTDSSTVSDSSSSSDSYTITGGETGTSSVSNSGGYASTSASGQQSATDSLSGTFTASDASADSATLQATASYSLTELGSYGNGCFALSCYLYSSGESATLSAQDTKTDSLSVNGNGNDSATSAETTLSGLAGTMGLMTVSDTSSTSGNETATQSVSSADTRTANEIMSLVQNLYQAGTYAGNSYSLSSVVFTSSATDSVVTQDSSAMSGNESSTASGTRRSAQTGGDAGDSGSGQDNFSDSALDTGSSSASTTDSSLACYIVYEAGSYAAGAYSLSSYNLLEQSNETVLVSDASAEAYSDSGSDTGATAVIDGVTRYSGSSSFSDSDSSAQTLTETIIDGFLLSEQGSFGGGSFALSSYVFSEQESDSSSFTEQDSSTDSFTGTNQGAAYSGNGSGSGSKQYVFSSSGSLTEQGSYASGSFALGTVTYQGSGNDCFSDNGSADETWTGGYSGTESASNQSGGNSSYSLFAAGSFNGGAYALASYLLAGNSAGSCANSSGDAETLNGAASSWAKAASGQESDTLWQSGATSGGAYSNVSYNYTDASSGTTTAQAQGPGYQSSDTWLSTASTQETGSGTSGTQAQAGLSSYSWDEGSGGQSSSSGSSGAPSATLPGATVQFPAPDGTTVPVAGVGAGGGSAAPVPASPNLGVVRTTGNWLATVNQVAQQTVGQGAATGAANTGNGKGRSALKHGNKAPGAANAEGQPAQAQAKGNGPDQEGAGGNGGGEQGAGSEESGWFDWLDWKAVGKWYVEKQVQVLTLPISAPVAFISGILDFSTFKQKFEANHEDNPSALAFVATALTYVPVISTVTTAVEGVDGTSLHANNIGDSLSTTDRVLKGVDVVGDIIQMIAMEKVVGSAKLPGLTSEASSSAEAGLRPNLGQSGLTNVAPAWEGVGPARPTTAAPVSPVVPGGGPAPLGPGVGATVGATAAAAGRTQITPPAGTGGGNAPQPAPGGGAQQPPLPPPPAPPAAPPPPPPGGPNAPKRLKQDVYILDKDGKDIAQLDVWEVTADGEKIFIEQKDGTGIGKINPKTGKPFVDPAKAIADFGQKQILQAGRKKATALRDGVATRGTRPGEAVPGIDEIKSAKKIRFEIKADTPEIRAEVEKQLAQLRIEFPNLEFEAVYGANP
jgi:hypothetical protein